MRGFKGQLILGQMEASIGGTKLELYGAYNPPQSTLWPQQFVPTVASGQPSRVPAHRVYCCNLI